MKRVVLIIISLVLLILDNTLMPFLAIRGVYPSLLTIFALSYSIINGYLEGIFIGVLSGMLQDIYFFNGFGLNSLCNMIICLIGAKIGENIFKEKALIPFISTFALSILKDVMIFAILFIMKKKINYFNIPFVAIYNMVISIFIYKRVYKLSQKSYMKSDWNF
ncbi:rod shape-determining protein MreD [Clostridium sp. MSJ-4]|uniref:Rod shape-determining protein MreD n=1 Tax=Clostridium simiarum TaxID=2841506 RepID=A0ABS6F2M7_9CLOT|nr:MULTISPECIES: rod shape-determining protein MreD [Clostridium]MBU5592740.1 rod shape-determining protein MreD [Clostridium simiarum]